MSATQPPCRNVEWFKRFPTGGTTYVAPPRLTPQTVNYVSTRFREMPNGGGTVYQTPGGESGGGESGNVGDPK